MALSSINVYVLTQHGKFKLNFVASKDPAYGKQYKFSVDTSTTTGKDLVQQITNKCGSPPLKKSGDTPALYYFKNVAPLPDKADGVEFMQTAQELSNRGLPNIMDQTLYSAVPVYESSILADKQIDETGLIFCLTFRYRY
ncbi:hypothetical protein [Pseudomonas palleroniana]|uniref:hypothetical protein n=1 Tax=Pseudomonas palleroniana TaxID=191390 RepID=UPI0018E6D653|nr:hypothetical protein [Pseudomonas palleroniana]MBI6912283.1 hypothetical protein [Pseudomonas palleroniana]